MSDNDSVQVKNALDDVEEKLGDSLRSLIDSIRILNPEYANYFCLEKNDAGWRIDCKATMKPERWTKSSTTTTTIKIEQMNETVENVKAEETPVTANSIHKKQLSTRKRFIQSLRRLFKIS